MLELITGPPGCGKTTMYVNKLASQHFGKIIWVAEPFQSIVKDKSSKNTNNFIQFVNWADALGEGLEFFNEGDILIIDEAHLLYSSEYRGFKLTSIKAIFEKYKNLILITATPKKIIREINENRLQFTHTPVKKRLKRPSIKVNLFNTIVSKYLNNINIRDYSIININNSKQLYSITEHWKTDNFLGDSVLVRSYYNEFNNFVFAPRHIDEVWDFGGVKNKDVFIGTVALGQGVDKDLKEEGVNSSGFSAIPLELDDLFKLDEEKKKEEPNLVHDEKILFDANSYKIDKTDFLNLYEYIAENIIQGDRFRYNTNIEIDVIYNKTEEEDISYFVDEISSYIHFVYGEDTEILIEELEFIDAPLLKIINGFGYKEFSECLNSYKTNHSFNKKKINERFYEILKSLIDDTNDIYKRKNGALKTVGKITGELFEKFVLDRKFVDDKLIRYYKTINALFKFLDFLKSEEVRKKYIEDRFQDKITEENALKDMGLPYKNDDEINSEIIQELCNFIEMVFIMTIKLLGYNINFSDELYKRGGNDGQQCPRKLRGLMICKDYDVKGAHIAALVKAFKPDYDIKKILDEVDIYNLNGEIEKERFREILLSFKGYKDLGDEGISKIFPTDREIVKRTLVASINSLNVDKRRKLVEDYIQSKFNYTISKDDWIGLLRKMSLIFNLSGTDKKESKKLGYYNGIFFENKWLGHLNAIPEVFRIYDGFGVILEECDAEKIKKEIEEKHNIKLSEEQILKIRGVNYKNFNDFYNEVNTEGISEEEMYTYVKENIKEVFYELIKVSKIFCKGRYKRKNKGKAEGKAVKEKNYLCTKDIEINGKEYKSGEVYSFGKDFTKSVGNKRRHFSQVK